MVTNNLNLWKEERSWGLAPYVFIDEENVHSKALFSKLGFIKQNLCTWEGYTRKNTENTNPDGIVVCKAKLEDLKSMFVLHESNHISKLSSEEAEAEGFVTASYSIDDLQEM